MTNPGEEQNAAWHADPANWRWGLFYYNPRDPRLLPPKRTPWFGWTINFANPLSIVLWLGLLAAVWGLVCLVERYTP